MDGEGSVGKNSKNQLTDVQGIEILRYHENISHSFFLKKGHGNMFIIRSPISNDADTYYSFSNNLKNVSNLEFKNKNISSTYVLRFTDKINKLNGLY